LPRVMDSSRASVSTPMRGDSVGVPEVVGGGDTIAHHPDSALAGQRVDHVARVSRHQEIDVARRTAASSGTCREICREERPSGAAANQNNLSEQCPAAHSDDYLPAQASASGSGKDSFGRLTVSAACCADLSWNDRGRSRLSMPWPWHHPVPVAAVPTPPCLATRGRRA